MKTKVRDCAILALMLGTGIRVSECVGLNLDDLDLEENGIHIHRKGGKESTVYFSDEVAQYLKRYFEERTAQDLISNRNLPFSVSEKTAHCCTQC